MALGRTNAPMGQMIIALAFGGRGGIYPIAIHRSFVSGLWV